MYDAIVIGTGFGATVAALRLFELGKKNVLVLERGTWWVSSEKLGAPPASTKPALPVWAEQQSPRQPVQYFPRPDHSRGLIDLFASIRHASNEQGLYQYSVFDEVHVVTASGVGGGSLIYANVTLRPKQAVLDSIGLALGDADYGAAYAWMARYRGKLHNIVTKVPLPGRDVSALAPAEDYLYLDRSRALRDAAPGVMQKLGLKEAPWRPLDLSIIEYEDGQGSDAAKAHTFCDRRGRCILGCPPAATHALNKPLFDHVLSDPRTGFTLVPLAEVRYIRRAVDSQTYSVVYRDHRDDREHEVTAPVVFLGAGTLGTTEILLRSRDVGGLSLSDALGAHFSTNGDFGAFAVGTKMPVYSTRGPINTCAVQVELDGGHITVEDCAIPSMFASVTSVALEVLDNFAKREFFKAQMKLAWTMKSMPELRDFLPHLPDTHDPLTNQTEAEMVANTFFFNVMGQDDASGVFTLDDDKLRLSWPKPIANHPIFASIEKVLSAFAEQMGADYVPLPTWHGLMNKKLLVTHPLGGCAIGDSKNDGVVDRVGRVFDADGGVYAGLFVVDGSTIPGAVAVNPSLTIVAQALKTVDAAFPVTQTQTV